MYNSLSLNDSRYGSIFEDMFGNNIFSEFRTNELKVTKVEENSCTYSIDLAGYEKDEIKVTTDPESRTLSIVAKSEGDSRRKYTGTYTITKNYETEGITAKCKNGVLYIEIPKKVKKDTSSVEVKVE